jgi:hypothetical protein
VMAAAPGRLAEATAGLTGRRASMRMAICTVDQSPIRPVVLRYFTEFN